jgi:DNA repair protein RadC
MSQLEQIGRTPAFVRIATALQASHTLAQEGSVSHRAGRQDEPSLTDANRLLAIRDQSGNYLPATDDQVIKAANAVIDRKMVRGELFSSPLDTQQFLSLKIGALEHEVFVALWLDAQHRLLEYVELSHGTIDCATVYPRMVVKQALLANACACIFAHNHPSGLPEPSAADRSLTTRLAQALATIDVRVLDHIVVAGHRFESFAERGWI